MPDAKVYGIIALKGGVGKTSVVSNLGTSLANDFDKKVLLVDANFSTPHLGLHLGMVNPEYTLHSALSNKHSIYEAIYQHNLGFHIIPGQIAPNKVEHLSLKNHIDKLRNIYDVILIDSSPSLNDELYATMMAADELLVVSTPDYPTLSSTLHAIKIARQKNTKIKGIILNKVRKKKFELSKQDIKNASDVNVLAILPDDVHVLAGQAEMKPITVYKPRREVSKNITKLAGSLVGEKKKFRFFRRNK